MSRNGLPQADLGIGDGAAVGEHAHGPASRAGQGESGASLLRIGECTHFPAVCAARASLSSSLTPLLRRGNSLATLGALSARIGSPRGGFPNNPLTLSRSYANSVLQALYFSKPFRTLIESYVPPSNSPTLASPPAFAFAPDAPLSPRNGIALPSSPQRPHTTGAIGQPPSPSRALSPASVSTGSNRRSLSRPGTSSGRGTLANAFGHARQSSNESSANGSKDGGSFVGSVRGGLAGGSGGAPLFSAPSFSGVGTPTANGTLSTDTESTLLTTLHDLFVTISAQPKTCATVAPQAFINQLKKDNEFFRSTLHQDAHEFLNYLINMIAETVEKQEKGKSKKRLGSKENDAKTWVHQLFEGILTSETRCLTCETVRYHAISSRLAG